MLHGPQRGIFDLDFALPAVCADRIENGQADIGIIPAIEVPRLGLEYFRGTGIASRGAVRSILLISKVPFSRIKILAADAGSRTSVALTRIVLAKKYGAEPNVLSMPADLTAMLEQADAALIIGDPALRLDPLTLPYHVADLGTEWTEMTGLPMVFAVWAARPEFITERSSRAFIESCRFGLNHMEEVLQSEYAARGISLQLARAYFTDHIVFELGAEEYDGLALYWKFAKKLEQVFA